MENMKLHLQPNVTLVAGRQLDALVAEKVMGWKLLKQMTIPPKAVAGFPPGTEDDGKADFHEIPHYSTDIAAAWEVVALFPHKYLFQWDKFENGRWECRFSDSDDASKLVHADTAPLAICKAALKAAEESHPNNLEEMMKTKLDRKCQHCGSRVSALGPYHDAINCVKVKK